MIVKDGEKLVNCRNWSTLVHPETLERDEEDSSGNYGKFSCEPLERGFGTTLGNALRRVLLSSLQGAAIVAVRIKGIQHEFTTIPGVMEDITDIILNLKQLRLQMSTDAPQRIELNVNQSGAVTAAQFQTTQHLEILNPDLHIATLSEDIEFGIEAEVRMGKGYVPAEAHEGLDEEIGLITMDASFSPIRKVAYRVEQARVGQMTNFDKLVLEVTTDGSVVPEDAVAYSAKILKEQLAVFINFNEDSANVCESKGAGTESLNSNLFKHIDDLELPVRANNCLKSANINIVGELVQKTESDMLKTKNFGRKSLEDIRKVLHELGLDFGMKLDGFEEQYKKWRERNQQDEA